MADLENLKGSYKISSLLPLSISTGSAASSPDLPRGLVAGAQHRLGYGTAVTQDQAAGENLCERDLGNASAGTQEQCLHLVPHPGSCLTMPWVYLRPASCLTAPALLPQLLGTASVRTQQGTGAPG